MSRRLIALPFASLVMAVLVPLGWSGTASAGSEQLTFQVSDARAYGYKASIAQPVIQIAPKCDPKTDKYKCDGYNHKLNCPPKVAFGSNKRPADPKPPETDGISGTAGEGAGNDPNGTGVPQSSAVRLNRLFSDGSVGHTGAVLSSNGVASLQYVELGNPPWDNDGHTETDAFTNQANYEERCYPTTKDTEEGTDYAHMFSHSYKGPETIHYSECFETQCQFNLGPLTPTAEHGVTEVHLNESGDVVHGVLSSLLENLQFPGGFPLTIDELRSYVTFQSDGTASGLRWQVVSTAQGVRFAGAPIALPQGQSIELGAGDQSTAVGMAGPYVSTEKDGSTLNVVAPGMFVATTQQTAFFAGIEITANFGQGSTLTFPSLPPIKTPGPSGGGGQAGSGGFLGGGGGPQPSLPQASGGGGTAQPLPQAEPQVSLLSRTDAPWAPASILALGLLGLIAVFMRWAQQFEWGRRLYEMQPMRSFEWLYRAFLKT